jgi:hypothetical protein
MVRLDLFITRRRRASAIRERSPRAQITEVDPFRAAAGFRMGVVRITGDEYETAVALSREARGT